MAGLGENSVGDVYDLVGRDASQSSESLCEVSPPSMMAGLSENSVGDVFDMVGREASQSSVSLCEVSSPSMIAGLGDVACAMLSIRSAGRPPKAVSRFARCPHRACLQVWAIKA